MERKVKVSIIIGLNILIAGVFAFFYFTGGIDFSFPYVGIAVFVISIAVLVIRYSKNKKETPQTGRDTSFYPEDQDLPAISSSKQKTCYWCGYPLQKNTEFCAECGNKVQSCSVCKLPISHGEEVGKCKYCETQGHLTHLLEWVKTQGKCPYCLQSISQNEILLVTR